MIAEIFTDSNVSEIRPNMPPLLTLLGQSFGSDASGHDSTRRRKSVMDPDTNDFERRLSEDLEKDLVLDFSSKSQSQGGPYLSFVFVSVFVFVPVLYFSCLCFFMSLSCTFSSKSQSQGVPSLDFPPNSTTPVSPP